MSSFFVLASLITFFSASGTPCPLITQGLILARLQAPLDGMWGFFYWSDLIPVISWYFTLYDSSDIYLPYFIVRKCLPSLSSLGFHSHEDFKVLKGQGHNLSVISIPPRGTLIDIIGTTKIFVNFITFFWQCHVACGILVPQPEIKPGPWQWKHQVLTTGPPRSSFRMVNIWLKKTSKVIHGRRDLFIEKEFPIIVLCYSFLIHFFLLILSINSPPSWGNFLAFPVIQSLLGPVFNGLGTKTSKPQATAKKTQKTPHFIHEYIP